MHDEVIGDRVTVRHCRSSFRRLRPRSWTLEFPAEEIADQLMAEAEEQEKSLPVVIHFVVSHEQAELIDSAVERASDGTVGRDRKARGLANLAKHFLSCQANGTR